MNNKIFVYGSLLENFFNYDKYLVGKVKNRSYAKTKGKLYHQILKGYPAMIKGNDFVYGELLELYDWENTVVNMDNLEGFYGEGNPDNDYNRVLIEVEVLPDNTKELAYVYMYNCSDEKKLSEEIYLRNGDWRAFIESK